MRCGCTATGWPRRGESKLGARRHVGRFAGCESGDAAQLDRGRRTGDGLRGPASSRSTESEEVRALKKRVAELERANEILKTSAAFFAQAELDRRLR